MPAVVSPIFSEESLLALIIYATADGSFNDVRHLCIKRGLNSRQTERTRRHFSKRQAERVALGLLAPGQIHPFPESEVLKFIEELVNNAGGAAPTDPGESLGGGERIVDELCAVIARRRKVEPDEVDDNEVALFGWGEPLDKALERLEWLLEQRVVRDDEFLRQLSKWTKISLEKLRKLRNPL
jgi:hypothetical protein